MLSGYFLRLRNSDREKWLLSLVFSIDFPGYEFHIIVESEDAGDEQEGLGDSSWLLTQHRDLAGGAEDGGNDVTHDLEDGLDLFVHNFACF